MKETETIIKFFSEYLGSEIDKEFVSAILNNYSAYSPARLPNSDVILGKLDKLFEIIILKTTDGKYNKKLCDVEVPEDHIRDILEKYSKQLKFIVFKFEKLVSDNHFINLDEFKKIVPYINTNNYDPPSIYTILMFLEFLYIKRKFKYDFEEEALKLCNKFWHLFNTNETVYREDITLILDEGLEYRIYDV